VEPKADNTVKAERHERVRRHLDCSHDENLNAILGLGRRIRGVETDEVLNKLTGYFSCAISDCKLVAKIARVYDLAVRVDSRPGVRVHQ